MDGAGADAETGGDLIEREAAEDAKFNDGGLALVEEGEFADGIADGEAVLEGSSGCRGGSWGWRGRGESGAAAGVIDEHVLHDEGKEGEAWIGLRGVAGRAVVAEESFVEEGGWAEGNGAGLPAHDGFRQLAQAEVSQLGDLIK